jgi:hypothetical protein
MGNDSINVVISHMNMGYLVTLLLAPPLSGDVEHGAVKRGRGRHAPVYWKAPNDSAHLRRGLGTVG